MKLNLKNTVLWKSFDPQYLWTAIHPSGMGLVRFLFGLLMIEQVYKYEGYIGGYLVNARYLLHYDFFEWIEMMPADWLPVFFLLMYISVGMIVTGLFYRLGMVFFFLGQTYCFLIDKGHYNNHYYMISLVAFWMIFTHWNRWLSVDNWIAKRLHRQEGGGLLLRIGRALWAKRHPAGVPRWHLLCIQLLIFIVYLFGATAKLNPDWIEAYPMRIWMEERAHWEVVGPLLATTWFAYFLSYAGILFDFTAAFVLMGNNLRLKILFLIFFLMPFHLMNDQLWRIGVFPEMMLAMTLLFFDPALPARVVGWLRGIVGRKRVRWAETRVPIDTVLPLPRSRKFIMGSLIVFFAWQFLFPLRIHLYPWPCEWHTNAQHFSWRMMLTDRHSALRLRVEMGGQPLGYVRLEDYFTIRQYRVFVKDPPEIVRFAHYLAEDMQANGAPQPPNIYATLWRSINGRPYQLVMDSTADLTQLRYDPVVIQDWLYPFENTAKKKDNFGLLYDEEALNLGFGKFLGEPTK